MRTTPSWFLSLLLFSGVGSAQSVSFFDTDATWLSDPVGATLAAAGPVSDANPPSATPAQSTGAESPISIDYLKILWADAVETATGPFHWDHDEWRNAGLIGGGLILTGAFLDKPIRDAVQRNRSTSSDRFFRHIQKFGTKQYGFPVLAGFYAYGEFTDDDEAKTTALDGVSASLISAFVTSTLKGAIGRARPNTGLGPHHFRPGNGDMRFRPGTRPARSRLHRSSPRTTTMSGSTRAPTRSLPWSASPAFTSMRIGHRMSSPAGSLAD